MTPQPIGWLGIVRLGLAQTALGSIVVLTTSTMNRVMVVELALPAMLPGALVALHYAVQVLRPRLGYGSDMGGRRTPWIIGGMAILALGGIAAALATAWMASYPVGGIALAVVAFLLIGVGVGAAGTSLLVLLAKRVDERKRAAAATIVWVMMIAGFVVTAATAGHFLDPFSPARLVAVTTVVACAALALTLVAVWNVEGVGEAGHAIDGRADTPKPPFRAALAQVWERTGGAPLHDLRLRIDARLQRPGSDPRALRRLRVRLHPRRIDEACGRAARRRAARDAASWVRGQCGGPAGAWDRCAPGRSAAASPPRLRSPPSLPPD